MDQTLTTPWTTGQKIAFRFAFLFFGFTTIINWTLTLFFAGLAISKKSFPVDGVFKWMSVPFSWLDRHLFHTGYDPKLHGAFPQDNHFGSVFYLAIFLISTIAVIIWSIAGKNKRNYPTLSYWFNLYLRYTLAITIIGYGIDKVIPVQMSWPTAAAMLSNYGEQDRFSVLWRFMGMSPGYMILTGACEVIAGLLLFSRRTLLLGYLILLSILVNVVALNWFYNVPVKMYSAQLMLYNLYLLAPYSRRLIQFFFFDRIVPVPRTQHANSDKTTWSLFHYSYPQKDQLQLVGKWKGKDIQVTMQSFPVDSIPLNKEEIRLIRD